MYIQATLLKNYEQKCKSKLTVVLGKFERDLLRIATSNALSNKYTKFHNHFAFGFEGYRLPKYLTFWWVQ